MTLDELENQGWLTSEAEAHSLLSPDTNQNDTPWIARFALGLGAWMAGVFLSGFLLIALESEMRKGTVPLVVGLLVIAGSIALMRHGKGIFLQQLALSWNLAGTLLFVFGTYQAFETSGEFYSCLIALTILCPIVYWLSDHPVQRFLSVIWVAALCLITALEDSSSLLFYLGIAISLALLFVGLSGWKPHATIKPATIAGLTSVVGFLIVLSVQWNWIDEAFLSKSFQFAQIVVPISFTGLLWFLCQPTGKAALFQILIFGAILLAIGWAGAPGVAAGLGLMAIAHARGDRWLTSVAILTLGTFLILFYYFLGITLMAKSLWLIGIGAVLLVLGLTALRKGVASKSIAAP